jgi:WD40 repeat protein
VATGALTLTVKTTYHWIPDAVVQDTSALTCTLPCCETHDLAGVDRSAVTALRFNASGVQLASGAQDTDIVVWDVVSQAGLFRLRGHHGQVCQSIIHATIHEYNMSTS